MNPEADGWVTVHPLPEAADLMPPPEFYEAMVKHCRCCAMCSTRPCDGVCAGGMCDQVRCNCDDPDDDGYHYDDDSDDYDGMSGEQAREGGGGDREIP